MLKKSYLYTSTAYKWSLVTYYIRLLIILQKTVVGDLKRSQRLSTCASAEVYNITEQSEYSPTSLLG